MNLQGHIDLINKSSDIFKEAIETSIMAGQEVKMVNPRFHALASAIVAIIKEMNNLKQEERYSLLCTFMHGISSNELEWLKLTGKMKP